MGVLSGLRNRLLPDAQRRTLEELRLELDPGAGDVAAKRSAFWSMLVLSALIASAGVLSDSTATVIGAMIIAPLSTPIMGVALALVRRERSSALVVVALGAALVVGIGVVFAALLPGSYDLHTNSQIVGRTSPGILDLVAAVATGLAGAVGLARKDVAAVLPGVAIAISLVPPLAVVGVCLGRGEVEMAVGASLLFLSNLVSLVVAGTFVFAALDLAETSGLTSVSLRRSRLVLGAVVVLVSLPLIANTVVTVLISAWTERADVAATSWVSTVPGARVDRVTFRARTLGVDVVAPGKLPPSSTLLAALRPEVPDDLHVSIEVTGGRTIDAGDVGG